MKMKCIIKDKAGNSPWVLEQLNFDVFKPFFSIEQNISADFEDGFSGGVRLLNG